ncbi:MAG: nuclear transport factor 2 family protein [Bacteroidetes bacterium]|nr:nuclear transport factor 2 family protein [Bacteroidota bacterium]
MSGKYFRLPNLKHKVIGFLLFSFCGWIMIACQSKPNPQNIKQEIVAAEAAFEKMAAEKSIAQAFYEFADKNATINRGQLIHGREAILDFYKNAGLENARLQWAPDSVFVSEAGDMAYTYGKYKMTLPDTSGQIIAKTGIFHTVWKRQPDGSWKYVWD